MADKKQVKKYYTIDHEKKYITVDTTVKPSNGDEEAVALFVKMGYKMRIKSQDRAIKMRAQADTMNAAEIRELLKDDSKALKKFDDIIHGKKTGITNAEGKYGFFAAKKWFKDEYKAK